MDGIFTPYFLQSACAKQVGNIIRLHVNGLPDLEPVLDMSYNGRVIVKYYRNGRLETVVINEQYTKIEEPDTNSYILIYGDVTRLNLGAPANGNIDAVVCDKCKSLMSLTTSSDTKHLKVGKYLTSLTVSGTAINLIEYPANNNNVSTEIANAITAATDNNGTIYTDADGTYYNTIEQAATAKGWTVITSNEE